MRQNPTFSGKLFWQVWKRGQSWREVCREKKKAGQLRPAKPYAIFALLDAGGLLFSRARYLQTTGGDNQESEPPSTSESNQI